jgi:hypothetical protein
VNRHELGLAARRRELVARSAAQREALTASAEPLLRKTATLDRVVGYVRGHPTAVALVVGAVALVGPRRLFDMAARVLTVYALFRR